jgi:hypothetical protein
MIGPVSETGKTMLASLQGAMARGMPVDQAITYVKSMAQQGVAPLVDLYALLKQFERLKQPVAQPPQGGSVREQLNMLETGQGAMGPQAGAAPMEQGLGGLNAGSMQNPQFAGGGIVAFQEGGETESFTPELYTLPKTREEEAQRIVDQLNRLPEFKARREAEMRERGIGKFAKSLEMGKEYAETLGEEAELLPEELAALDEEAYYADIAATKEPDFLSALGAAEPKRVERKRATKKEAAIAKDKARLEKIIRQSAVEAAEKGDYEALEKIRTDLETLRGSAVEGMFKAEEAAATRKTMIDQTDPGRLKAMEASQIKIILDPNSSEEQRKTAQKNLEIIRGAGKRASGSDALKRSRLVAVERRILETEKALSEPTGQIPATKAILEDRLAELNEEKSMILYENPDLSAGQGMMQGSAEMPPGFQPLTP